MAPVTAHAANAAQALDWQTWVTFGLGLLALAYLVRRWWPRRNQTAPSCGTGDVQGSAKGGCGSCDGCGSARATPARDHRHGRPADRLPMPPLEKQAVQPVHWHPPRRPH